MSFNNPEGELITDREINELIKIGKLYSDKDIDYLQKNIDNLNLKFDGATQRNLHYYFENTDRGYTKSELSYIFIGIVIGEIVLRGGEELSGWGFGSVTATTKVHRQIRNKYPLRAELMKRWSKQFGFINDYFYSM